MEWGDPTSERASQEAKHANKDSLGAAAEIAGTNEYNELMEAIDSERPLNPDQQALLDKMREKLNAHEKRTTRHH